MMMIFIVATKKHGFSSFPCERVSTTVQQYYLCILLFVSMTWQVSQKTKPQVCAVITIVVRRVVGTEHTLLRSFHRSTFHSSHYDIIEL